MKKIKPIYIPMFQHLLWAALSAALLQPLVHSVNAFNGTAHSFRAFNSTAHSFRAKLHTGPIDDAKCNVEQLEEANDSQLYSILRDLKNTSFFRTFAVDLDQKCPLATLGQPKKEVHSSSLSSTSSSSASSSLPLAPSSPSSASSSLSSSASSSFSSTLPSSSVGGSGDGESSIQMGKADNSASGFGNLGFLDNEEDESSCTGSVDAEPDAKPACTIESDEESLMVWHEKESFSSSASSGLDSEPMMEKNIDDVGIEKQRVDEEEFECDGGDMAEEIDKDDAPLCELTSDEMTEYYADNESTSPLQDFLSSALNSINDKMGWDSEAEKRTFTWSQPSDIVISEDKDFPCDDEPTDGLLPETFWLDMCSNISEGDGVQVVNLALNPERNTGYNGTHIWRTIYEENCINLDGDKDQPMCYEERILYRLLSGLHVSTTLSIAKNYYPPNKRKGRVKYEPNLSYFFEKVGQHPDYVRNLHFSYVVLLRALKKANSFLYSYEIRTGNIVDDETATILLRRLLDSSILKSCNNVFTAFDESLMFRQQTVLNAGRESQELVTLQQNFKGVFHNISSILDCVQCQQCKLHGKMAMLGYGTALKILFLPREELIASSLSRNEVVALINTIAKMSEAIMEVRELTTMYWMDQKETEQEDPPPKNTYENDATDPFVATAPSVAVDSFDAAVGAISSLAKEGLISDEQEVAMIKLALSRNEDILVLAKYYSSNLDKFLVHTGNMDSLATLASSEPDAIVVGTGLAGLAATLNMLDRGGKVLLIEKEHRMGGNSNKASSGMNACCPNNDTNADNTESFLADVIRSAGDSARLPLINVLVENSASAVSWLRDRVGVDLSLMAQLGGHQHKRTHRPSNGMVGAEVIYGMQKAVKKYEKSGKVKIMVDTEVRKLIRDDVGRVIGVEVQNLSALDKALIQLTSPNIVLATGGFAADRSENSYLAKYRPELLNMPATAGHFSTGDGIGLATAVGASLVDMEKIQIHPTGWVDPKDPRNPNKILAAELMRGVGGVLINKAGQRFCNELGTRAYVTDKMLSHDPSYASTRKWNEANEIPTFSLVLSSSAAEDGKKHVDHYTHKGLLKKLEGVSALADWMGINVDIVRRTILQYQDESEEGADQWGKSSFRGVAQQNLNTETFYAGTVTPVLHYCMGGITIDTEGNVLDEDNVPIPGLHAAGEVSGGVHGNNRLGGNSLLECTVFGSIVGKKIPIIQQQTQPKSRVIIPMIEKEEISPPQERKVTQGELAKHNKPDDCWVAIHGCVYDLTEFAEEHPAGAQSIYKLGGLDGTEAFAAIHNKNLMDDFEEDKIGIYELTSYARDM